MKFKVDLSLDLWLVDVEIEAKSKDEALNELSRLVVLDTEELIHNAIIKSAEYKNDDWELVEKRVTVKATDIEYEVSEEDAEYNNMTVEQILSNLPKELEVSFDLYKDSDIEDEITDAITYKTDWLVKSFKYEVIKEA